MEIIDRILALMDQNNMTANEFTTRLSLSNSAITEWKKGKAKPSVDAVIKIAEYFGISTDQLLGREDMGGKNDIPHLSEEDLQILDYYHRLDREDKEYIRSKMIVLNREA